MKVRIKFAKLGYMKFVGHLDIMRFFQKAIRRANIDVVYSEGFSPHQKMSFASPLGVGMTSIGEYFDIEVNSSLEPSEAITQLNNSMVEGIKVLNYTILPDDSGKAMSLVAAADYFVPVCNGMTNQELYTAIENIISSDTFEVYKKTKCTEGVQEVRKYIYEMKPMTYEGKSGIFMKLSAGSVYNLKPEPIAIKMGLVDEETAEYIITRLETYRLTSKGFMPLDYIDK